MRRPAVRSHKYFATSRCPYAPTTRPYVGTWALDIANCQTPQDSQDAPLVIAKDRYD